MKKSNVYTRTGDQGQTSLADGSRISKFDVRLDSYGEIDELNSHVGLLVSLVREERVREMLLDVQRTLFVVGALLAMPPKGEKTSTCVLTKDHVSNLEQCIDSLHEGLPAWRGVRGDGGISQEIRDAGAAARRDGRHRHEHGTAQTGGIKHYGNDAIRH